MYKKEKPFSGGESRSVPEAPQEAGSGSLKGKADKRAKAEAMLAILDSLHRLILEDEPHIKAYKKARKLHSEILSSMMEYFDSGKFERKIDRSFRLNNDNDSGEDRPVIFLDSDFNMNTPEGEQGFLEFMVYKAAPNMNCITEDFIQQKRYRKPEKLEFLQSMLDSRAGLFSVTSVEMEEGYVNIEEVFTGAKYRIIDIALSGNPNVEHGYFYHRIITYRGMSFNTGLCIAFAKDDPFIREYIKRQKKDYKPHAELVRFLELYNQYIHNPRGMRVAIKDV